MIHSIAGKTPDADRAAFIGWNAEVAGEVVLKEESSVWFGAVLRADLAPITVGKRTNIQDNATLHVDNGAPCTVGDGVTVGHNAVLHGCTVEDGCLIGMGAIILTGAVIGARSIVGAGALVTEGKIFPPRSLILGSPAKATRSLEDREVKGMEDNTSTYVSLARSAAADYRQVKE